MKFTGRTFLLKLGDGGDPEVFTTVAAQRVGKWAISVGPQDSTTKDELDWRELTEGGVREFSIECSGLISDDASFDLLRDVAMSGAVVVAELDFMNGETFRAAIQIASNELSAEFRDAQQYSLTLDATTDPNFGDDANALLLIEGGDAIDLIENGDELLLFEEA